MFRCGKATGSEVSTAQGSLSHVLHRTSQRSRQGRDVEGQRTRVQEALCDLRERDKASRHGLQGQGLSRIDGPVVGHWLGTGDWLV